MQLSFHLILWHYLFNGVKFVSTLVDWGNRALIPNIGKDDRDEDDVKVFKYSRLEFMVCIFYHLIEDTINTTGFLGWRVFILSCSSFKVIGESWGFW